MCVFYKCREGFLQCPVCRIKLLLKLKLQVQSRINRGELNYMCHKVITITQMSSQLDSYPDASWVMIWGQQPLFHVNTPESPCEVWIISPSQLARWVMFPATVNILLADRATPRPDSYPQQAIWVTAINNSSLFLSGGRCCRVLLWFFALVLMHHDVSSSLAPRTGGASGEFAAWDSWLQYPAWPFLNHSSFIALNCPSSPGLSFVKTSGHKS